MIVCEPASDISGRFGVKGVYQFLQVFATIVNSCNIVYFLTWCLETCYLKFINYRNQSWSFNVCIQYAV